MNEGAAGPGDHGRLTQQLGQVHRRPKPVESAEIDRDGVADDGDA
ncbi:MAG: hypothetical protein QNJ84_17045 [Alphaproteobacteria bacterium]|nr:hypothetical protein [Alphaproteobacteria bacterium]